MNQTRKLTQGALYLAIIGALMIIDRQLSYLFTEILVLMFSVVIIMYSAKYEVKDGMLLSCGLVVLTVLFGSTTTYFYAPISILLGIIYSYFLNKNMNNHGLLIVSMLTFIAGEVLIMYVAMPLFGIESIENYIAGTRETFKIYYEAAGGNLGLSLEQIMSFFTDNIILMIIILSTILVGLMEGAIIHLLSIFLLRKLRIKDVERINLFNIKANPPIAYISIACVALSFVSNKIENQTIVLIFTALACIGALALIYYGYIYITLYSALTMPKSFRIILYFVIILAFPSSLLALMIVGFLYASGPLYRQLEKKGKQNEENNHS